MDAEVEIARGTIIEGSDFWITERFRRADGQDLLISDVTSWSVYVYDDGALVFSLVNQTPVAIGAGGTFSNSVLGPDGYSQRKYNFRHQMLGNAWEQYGGHTYRVEYDVLTTSGGHLQALADVCVVPVSHG